MTAARGGTTRITLPDGHALDVQIPAGTRDGQTIRLRGKGGAGMGNGAAGDALLSVTVADDPDWRRDGDDVVTTLPISLDEAVLGAKVEAETLDGPVMLTIPRGASSGQKLRLRGRGLAASLASASHGAGRLMSRTRAKAELGVSASLIMCFLRHLSEEDAFATRRLRLGGWAVPWILVQPTGHRRVVEGAPATSPWRVPRLAPEPSPDLLREADPDSV